PVERGAVRPHRTRGVGAQRFETREEPLVVPELLGRDLAISQPRRLVGRGVRLRLGSFVCLPLPVRDSAENLDERLVHRVPFRGGDGVPARRGRNPSSSKLTTKSATTAAGTPSSVANH